MIKDALMDDLEEGEARPTPLSNLNGKNSAGSNSGGKASVIYIPINRSDEVVEVRTDELPDNVEDLLGILQAEMAPLSLWLRVAVEYYKQGKIQQFQDILKEATSPDADLFFQSQTRDRIQVLNSQAAFYVSQAKHEKNKVQKDALFNLATLAYNKAEKIDITDELIYAGKGALQFAKGEYERALANFDFKETVPGMLGRAACKFQQGKYEEAIDCYRQALELNPLCPAAVRLGLAHCYAKLGKPELSKQAFERVLQLDEENIEAIVGLATCELNAAAATTSVELRTDASKRASKLLTRAYHLNPHHPRVLNLLADRLFHGKELTRAQELAENALKNSEIPAIRAESYFLLARIAQERSDYETALAQYAKAVELSPDHALALYGLGQMYIHKDELDKAIPLFEKVLAAYPDNVDILKVLGSLYSRLPAGEEDRKKRALQYLKRVCDSTKDAEALVELGQLQEQSNLPAAIQAYEKAEKVLDTKKQPVPPELWNNIGALQHQSKLYLDAQKAYMHALGSSGDASAPINFQTANVTTVYNLARLLEDMHEDGPAEAIYRKLVKEHPTYIDCYLRLAAMAHSRGHSVEAAEQLQEAFNIDQKHITAWSLFGQMHLEKEEWGAAQKKFERILENVDKKDSFSLVALGNMYYNAKFEKKEKEERYLKLALEFYWRVLQTEPKNIYAANGIALILAEKGSLIPARELLVQVREASDFADVCINLAHVYLLQGQKINAIKMYENTLQKFYGNKDTTVLLFLAKAYLEADKLDECKRTLLRAAHLRPSNPAIWFNLAIASEYSAATALRSDKATASVVRRAIAELQNATRWYRDLAASKTANGRYSTSKAGEHLKRCEKLLADAQRRLVSAEKVEAEQSIKRAEQQRISSQLAESKRKEAEEKERAAREALEEQQRIAKEQFEELEAKKAIWMREEQRVRERQAATAKRAGGRGRSAAAYEGSDAERSEDSAPDAQEPDNEFDIARAEAAEAAGREGAAPSSKDDWKAMRDKRNPAARKLAQKIRQQKDAEAQKERDAIRNIAGDNEADALPAEGTESARGKRRSKRKQVEGSLLDLLDPEDLSKLPAEEPEATFESGDEKSDAGAGSDGEKKHKKHKRKKDKKEKKEKKEKRHKKHKKHRSGGGGDAAEAEPAPAAAGEEAAPAPVEGGEGAAAEEPNQTVLMDAEVSAAADLSAVGAEGETPAPAAAADG